MHKVPSLTKVNHRYRGEAESYKHNLTMQQSLHDIRELYYTTYRNDSTNVKGQYDFIDDNMRALVEKPHDEIISDTSIYISIYDKNGIKGSYDFKQLQPIGNAIGIQNTLKILDNRIKEMYISIGGISN